MTRTFTQEQIYKMREEVLKGKSKFQVSKETQLSPTTVYEHTKDLPNKYRCESYISGKPLVHFDTGVAVGAMVTDKKSYVADLLYRIFENKMQYELVQSKPGHFKIKERLTGSVIRLQTNDELLRRTFWNHWEKKIQIKNRNHH